MPVGIIKLTAGFKVGLVDVDEAIISEIYRLFAEYEEIMNELIEYAHLRGSPALESYSMRNIMSYGGNIQHCHHIIFTLRVGMLPAYTGSSQN